METARMEASAEDGGHMPSKKLRVIVTRRLPERVEARMSELFDVVLRHEDTKMTTPELVRALKIADVLVPCINDTLDKSILAQAGPRLKLIANYGAGADHIDIGFAREKGILVSNTPGVVADDTADMAMALILAVARRMSEGMALMQSGTWEGWSPMALLGARLGGRRLGILGMGRIGQAVARRARAFGMQIDYHNRKPLHASIAQELQATYWETLDQMVARVDILSINCPHTPATYHLMNARRLKLMKPSALIVNTSRGEVLDEVALAHGLRAGELAGAGLDVFQRGVEPNPHLRALSNVVLLPHMGSATLESRLEMGERIILNIQNFADGHRPPDQILPDQNWVVRP